jgi:hypothetical protein
MLMPAVHLSGLACPLLFPYQVVEIIILRLFKGSRGRGFLATTKLFGSCRTAASL